MSCVSFFLVALVALIFCAQIAQSNCKNPIIFLFGDSNSDTGGLHAVFGGLTNYPNGCIFPNPPSERASNGRLIIDFLCENVSTSYLQPYLDALEPNFTNGANFAISGSSATYPGFGLATQVFQFIRFQNRSLELQSKGSKKLISREGFESALYMIDIGQNDLGQAFGNSSDVVVIDTKIDEVISKIENASMALYGKGGRKFWIHNTGPLGCLPAMIAAKKTNATNLDKIGCITYLNDGAQRLNKKLSILCQKLQSEMKDATIVYVDIYAMKYDLIANYGRYGFKNPLVACFNFPANACSEQSKYISWDGIHYTEAANAIFASKIASANYSTPPVPFNFFCSNLIM